jgi:biotin synthase
VSYYEEALNRYHLPLLELLDKARAVHRANHQSEEIQRCYLLSIKTGGCSEDCAYCAQSAHNKTQLHRHALFSVAEVHSAAVDARQKGAHRFCMGAAWSEIPEGEQFERVLEMVRDIKAEGLEVCATLGKLTPEQAVRLKQAGLDAYSHNLDTSREFYPSIITTRTYDDRLETIRSVRLAGLTVCSGGILGLGESIEDRCAMLAELAALQPQPESVPINLLMPCDGTPLEDAPSTEPMALIRTIAVARILMPKSRVRLAAGRIKLSLEAQVLAFYAGANSLFIGDRLLTTPNALPGGDEALFAAMGAVNGK